MVYGICVFEAVVSSCFASIPFESVLGNTLPVRQKFLMRTKKSRFLIRCLSIVMTVAFEFSVFLATRTIPPLIHNHRFFQIYPRYSVQIFPVHSKSHISRFSLKMSCQLMRALLTSTRKAWEKEVGSATVASLLSLIVHSSKVREAQDLFIPEMKGGDDDEDDARSNPKESYVEIFENNCLLIRLFVEGISQNYRRTSRCIS